MEGTPLSYPPMPPIWLLLIALLLGFSVNTVIGCDMEKCWKIYQDAKTAERAGILMDLVPAGETETPECIVLRTYIRCITTLSRTPGCRTSMRFQYAKTGIMGEMHQKRCKSNGTVYVPGVLEVPEVPNDNLMCSYPGERDYRHCGLFGDPHLRTFSNEFQTCKVAGAWSLINNKYLTVQVTNDPVVTSGGATATSKLTVMIKKNETCSASRFITYAAQTDNLPGSFDDGHTKYGPDDSVKLTEIEPGKYVKIYLRFIDTTILVRQIGRYFTFAIKMPVGIIQESHVKDTLELCASGCPTQERINYQKYLAQQKNQVLNVTPDSAGSGGVVMTRTDAVELCKQANVVDFYFDSCVFDLMTTGDKDFTAAAYQAWQDLIELTPGLQMSQTNRTDLTKYDQIHSGQAVTTSACGTRIILLTVILCIVQHFYHKS